MRMLLWLCIFAVNDKRVIHWWKSIPRGKFFMDHIFENSISNTTKQFSTGKSPRSKPWFHNQKYSTCLFFVYRESKKKRKLSSLNARDIQHCILHVVTTTKLAPPPRHIINKGIAWEIILKWCMAEQRQIDTMVN